MGLKDAKKGKDNANMGFFGILSYCKNGSSKRRYRIT